MSIPRVPHRYGVAVTPPPQNPAPAGGLKRPREADAAELHGLVPDKRPRTAPPAGKPAPAAASASPPLAENMLLTPPASPELRPAPGFPRRPLESGDIHPFAYVELAALVQHDEHGPLATAVFDALNRRQLAPAKDGKPGQYGMRVTLGSGRNAVMGLAATQEDGWIKPTHIAFSDFDYTAKAVEVSTGNEVSWKRPRLPAELMWQILQDTDHEPRAVLGFSSFNKDWHESLKDRRRLALFQIPIEYGIRPKGAPEGQALASVIQSRDDIWKAINLKSAHGPAGMRDAPPTVPRTLAGVPERLRGEALGSVTRAGLRRLPVNEFRPIRRHLIDMSKEVERKTGNANPALGALERSGGVGFALRDEDRKVVDEFLQQAERSGMRSRKRDSAFLALSAAGRFLDRCEPPGVPATLAGLRAGTKEQARLFVSAYATSAPKSSTQVPEKMMSWALDELQKSARSQG